MAGGSNSRRAGSESSNRKTSKSLTSNAMKCESCVKPVSDEDSGIECEDCLKWFHGSCVGIMDPRLYDLFSALPGAHWSCSVCDKAGSRLLKLERKVDEIPNEIKKLNSSLEEIQTMFTNTVTRKLDSMEVSYANVVKGLESNSTAINVTAQKVTKLSEIEAQDMRDKNLIIFGIREFKTKEETVEELQNLLKDCHLSKCIDQKNMYRLGRPKVTSGADQSQHENSKPRPIKISTTSKEEKWEIVRRINGLKKGGVFAKLDMTKEERAEDFQLYKTLMKTREENPENTYKIVKKKIVQTNI